MTRPKNGEIELKDAGGLFERGSQASNARRSFMNPAAGCHGCAPRPPTSFLRGRRPGSCHGQKVVTCRD